MQKAEPVRAGKKKVKEGNESNTHIISRTRDKNRYFKNGIIPGKNLLQVNFPSD